MVPKGLWSSSGLTAVSVSPQASALDALLDDSVMFAKKLRDMGQPVSLSVAEDLPHGFLSLSQLTKETEVASDICVKRIREVFQQNPPPLSPAQAAAFTKSIPLNPTELMRS